MVFTIDCTNRGCAAMMTPYLDPKTNKVYCSKCDGEIENVSPFTKNAMRASKQVKQKEKKSFAVKCACGHDDRPQIADGKVVCASCGQEQTQLTPHYAMMLKEQLKKLAEDK